MDFYSFSKDHEGYDAIFVVVDQLTKCSVSIPCFKTTGAREMAWLYVDRIYWWKEAPKSIVSNHEEQFISEFWGEICRILGVTLKLSTSEHPQTNGQTEIVNQHIKQRLQPFVNYYQNNWSELLPMVDHAAATVRSESTGFSPFALECGYEPRMSFD
jgi:transposase InsO family protein